MALFWNRWVVIRTEGGSRSELIDRLEAHFKTNGLKTKITIEGNSLKRIHVLKKDADLAKTLLDAFDEEH
ncbi:hypothetical protein BK120_04435 [Paenibacillus sp. FSL A5-0031]|uniref:hypothetical protein n=1 Tax=unclassified Paenibacillus TaxID=185978 RepID=UPI00096D2FAC|nr:hypothetical protein [Paenibacillus sp. FSL A5-0031]OME87235.1 hypothetical protein BK120_04435 [Paenibacillus sp. FSL A5-0031]